MINEEQEKYQGDQQSSSNDLNAEPIGVGTPLKDDEETPLYVGEEKHQPVVGIGSGTPLYDTDEEKEEKSEKSEVAEKAMPVKDPKPTPAAPIVNEEQTMVKEVSEDYQAKASKPMDEMEDADFAAQLEKSFTQEPEIGEIVQGTVIRIDEDGVVVDVGYKSEGVIAKEEFLDLQGQFHTQVGDQIEVLLERKENKEGLLVLSKKKVDRRIGWNKAKVALSNDSSIEGLVYEKCKGGFMVDLGGLSAFLPSSHIDIKPIADTDDVIGKRFQMKVIKMNKQRGNIVVSRRNLLLEEQKQKRTEVMSKLAPGRLVHGVVKNITNYGAFLDIGGIDALLHVNDMSWSKVSNPRAVVTIGDELEVLVLSIDETNNRIALGLKQKSRDPWNDIEKKYPVDSIAEAEVVSLMEFGAFLKLEEGVEGLLPVSELSWTKRIRHPKDLLKVGDSVRVKILNINGANKKITMGLKQTEPEPFCAFIENAKVGDILNGEVKSLANYGAFVEIAEGVSGLIHISDLSWDQHGKKTSDVLKIGEKVKVKILEIQQEKKKISLGLKQLSADPWSKIAEKYSVGKSIAGKVIRTTKFGVFVELESGIEGLIHISQLEAEKGKREPNMPEIGSTISAKVVKLNKQEHKIGLSVREYLQEEEKAEMEKYLSSDSKPGFSLGDAVGDKMKELLKKVNGDQ